MFIGASSQPSKAGILIALFVSMASFAVAQVTPKAEPLDPGVKAQVNKLLNQNFNTFWFIQNKGQWDAEALYQASVKEATLWMMKDRIRFDVLQNNGDEKEEAPYAVTDADGNVEMVNEEYHGAFGPKRFKGHVWDVKFLNALPSVTLAPTRRREGDYNYLKGNDPAKWATDVPAFFEMWYEGLYKGVDLRMYSMQDARMEFDFIVKPGTDPNVIQLGFEGLKKVRLDADGSLVQVTSIGDSRLSPPVAYQEKDGVRISVPVAFKMEREVVSFVFPSGYDKSLPLVIDPTIIHGTYLTCAACDHYMFGVTADCSGYIYATGNVQNANFPVTVGAFDQTYNGGPGTNLSVRFGADVFVSKLGNNLSTLAYSTFIGGTGDDATYDIDLSNGGLATVAGASVSNNFPTVNAFDAVNSGRDAFLLRLNLTGNALIFSTYLGGEADDETGYGVSVDSFSNAYVTGYTESSNFPTVNAFDNTLGGAKDAFVAKFNSAGACLYSTYLGGSGGTGGTNFDPNPNALFESGMDVDADSLGNAIVVGCSQSGDFPLLNAYDNVFGSTSEAFVTVLNPTGSALLYSSFFGGGSTELAFAVEWRNSNIYVSGSTSSTDFPVVNAFQGTKSTGRDMFVLRLLSNYTPAFSTFLGGNGTDFGFGLAVNSCGEAFVTGQVSSTNMAVTADAYQTSFAGGPNDVIIARITASGALTYLTYFGGGFDDYNYFASPAFVNDQIFIFGTTTHSAGLFTDAAAIQAIKPNGTDDSPYINFWSFLSYDYPTPLCANVAGNFRVILPACSGNDISWNFGVDAIPQTAVGAGPHSVRFTTPGTRNITVYVGEPSCSVSQALSVTIINDPSCYSPENCTDGVDNDGDGLVDCYDPDCCTDPACANVPGTRL